VTEESRESRLNLSSIGVEALDDPATDPRLVTRMLHDIARSNRWLGGTDAVRYALARLLLPEHRGRDLTLFDVGTGAADLPLAARRWANRHGFSLVPLALERIPAAARLARDAGVPVILGCAGELPLRNRSVDIVLVSQVAHHLDRDSATRLFAAASAVARLGVIVADLRPMLLAATGFRLAGMALGFHRNTLADGVTSIRRSFRPDDLRQLCADAGANDVRVASRPGARVVAWWHTAGIVASHAS